MQSAKKKLAARMRQHIGYHIINAHIQSEPNLCGFCGSVGCNIKLLKTSTGLQSLFQLTASF